MPKKTWQQTTPTASVCLRARALYNLHFFICYIGSLSIPHQSDKSSTSSRSVTNRSEMRCNRDCGSGGGMVAGFTPGPGIKVTVGRADAAAADEELGAPASDARASQSSSACGSRACRKPRAQKWSASSPRGSPVTCGKGPATSAWIRGKIKSS